MTEAEKWAGEITLTFGDVCGCGCAQSPNNLVRYGLVGDSEDLFYFSIDAVSGEIFIRRSLVENANRNITLFEVSAVSIPSL